MDSRDGTRKMSLAGAVVGAIAASACCVGPLLLGLLGLGGAGALATFARYRPHILIATAGLLAAGFWLTYGKRVPTPPRASAPACDCERPQTRRSGRVMLWLSAALVAGFAALPNVLAWAGAHDRAPAVVAVGGVTHVIAVEGMDCAACAVPIRRAIEQVGGAQRVDVDVATGRVTVRHVVQPGIEARYVRAIQRLGYQATLQGE